MFQLRWKTRLSRETQRIPTRDFHFQVINQNVVDSIEQGTTFSNQTPSSLLRPLFDLWWTVFLAHGKVNNDRLEKKAPALWVTLKSLCLKKVFFFFFASTLFCVLIVFLEQLAVSSAAGYSENLGNYAELNFFKIYKRVRGGRTVWHTDGLMKQTRLSSGIGWLVSRRSVIKSWKSNYGNIGIGKREGPLFLSSKETYIKNVTKKLKNSANVIF